MKYPSSKVIVYSLIVLVLLALVVFIVSQNQNENIPVQSSNLYDFAPIERVTFNAIGKVVSMDNDRIIIEKLGESLSMSLSEEIRVMIFTIPDVSENPNLEPQIVEPELGSLTDIQIDSDISIFGTQTKDGSLVAENITIER
jgi:hypothetical protein